MSLDQHDICIRAANELAAAARALRHANSIFHLLVKAIADDELSLAEIGNEMTAMYAERAAAEADFFSGEA